MNTSEACFACCVRHNQVASTPALRKDMYCFMVQEKLFVEAVQKYEEWNLEVCISRYSLCALLNACDAVCFVIYVPGLGGARKWR